MKSLHEYFDLDSYSCSPGWFGFFEKSGRYDPKLIDIALDYFFDFFHKDLKYCTLAFNYSIYESIDCAQKSYNLNKDDTELLKYLVNKKWLKIDTTEDLDGLGFDSFDEMKKTYLKLHSSEFNDKEMFLIISAILRVGDFIGYCFILFEKENLIVYSHEDIGFGIICTHINSKSRADDFLAEIAKNTNFAAYSRKTR